MIQRHKQPGIVCTEHILPLNIRTTASLASLNNRSSVTAENRA